MDAVYSSEHLEFLLNARFSGFGARARAGFNTNFNQNKSRILVRLYQAYFTMVFDDPHGIDGVFTSNITVDDLRNYTGPGNPITYISSVTFGRKFYLLYESEDTEVNLRYALRASFRGFGVSASAETQLQARETLSRASVSVFQIGGGAEGGITAGMAADYDAIRFFLESGMNFSAQNVGAPISYTVRYLRNNQLVRLGNALEFEVEECVPAGVSTVEDTFRINFYDYTARIVHHNHNFGHCYHYLAIEVGVINNATGRREILARNPANGMQRYGRMHRTANNVREETYVIDFDLEEIRVARNNSLYISFMVRNRTHSWRRSSGFGSNHDYNDVVYYERTVFFEYLPNENRWIAREEGSEEFNATLFRTVAVNHPGGRRGGFIIENTFNYSVAIE